jgi:RimJ/RimL family protein N-acetyltransferase
VEPTIELREVTEEDLPFLYENEADPVAIRMAAFTSKDVPSREAFEARMHRMHDKPDVVLRTIIFDGEVAGSVGSYESDGHRHMTYWIRRELWGKGIATLALQALLDAIEMRPVYASAVGDNLGSIRVLEKCGFKRYGSEVAFAQGRGEDVEEVFFRLDPK